MNLLQVNYNMLFVCKLRGDGYMSDIIYLILAIISVNIFLIVYTMIKKPEKGWLHL